MGLKLEHFCEIEEKYAFNLKGSFLITFQNIKLNKTFKSVNLDFQNKLLKSEFCLIRELQLNFS